MTTLRGRRELVGAMEVSSKRSGNLDQDASGDKLEDSNDMQEVNSMP